MTANTPKHLEHPVTLTLELDELVWLRAFLKKERDLAEIDHQEVERLHSGVFHAHSGAQVVCGECGTQTVFRFPRSNGAARGDQQNFFHECSSFFSRHRER